MISGSKVECTTCGGNGWAERKVSTAEVTPNPIKPHPIGEPVREVNLLEWKPTADPFKAKGELRACPSCFAVEFKHGPLVARRPYFIGDVPALDVGCPICKADQQTRKGDQFMRCANCKTLLLVLEVVT